MKTTSAVRERPDSVSGRSRSPFLATLGLILVAALAAGCAGDYDGEEQKRRLIATAKSHFSGVTAHNTELSRLHYDPDARVRRRGGLWVVVEFKGDEYESILRMKSELDTRTRVAADRSC